MKEHIPVYIDFDFACVSGSDDLPCEGAKGTPNYAAPEVWARIPDRDPLRSDIYALGVLLYYLYNDGKLPYSGNFDQVREQVLNEPPMPSNTGMPKLDDLIMELIAKNPNERPTLDHAKSVLQDLIKS